MSTRHFGRLARSLAVVGIVSFAAVGLAGPREANVTPVAFAGVAQQNENDNNDDRTNDNTDERQLRGQVLEIWMPPSDESRPPEILVATIDEEVWSRVYNEQIARNGLNVGDHVRLQGEFGEYNVFDAYEIDVTDRCCDAPNSNGNDND